MGGGPSRPILPIDPLFMDTGCTALTVDNIVPTLTLDQAPFLFFYFQASTYHDMMGKLITKLNQFKPSDPNVAAKNENKHIYGPIYFLTAYEKATRMMHCYLYLPSMTPEGAPWPNYNFLGRTHRWMRRLVYGASYHVPVYTKCDKMFDYWGMYEKNPEYQYPSGFKYGCMTSDFFSRNGKSCQQSERAHMGMGIYDRDKKDLEYPQAYYHSYQINMNDTRLTNINKGPKALYWLQTHILSSNLDMLPGCSYSIISHNNKYILLLTNFGMVLFRNTYNINFIDFCVKKFAPIGLQPILIKWLGVWGEGTRMTIEDLNLNIYTTVNSSEILVFSEQIAKTGSSGPFTLVLDDDGRFRVYDVNNKDVISDKFRLDNENALSNNGGSENDGLDLYGEGDDSRGYDPIKDYMRRIINLKAYLRLKGYIINENQNNKNKKDNKDKTQNKTDNKKNNKKNKLHLPPYDSKVDYTKRYDDLLVYLKNMGLIRQSAVDHWRDDVKAAQHIAAKNHQVKDPNVQKRPKPSELLKSDNYNKNTSETPQERATRIQNEAKARSDADAANEKKRQEAEDPSPKEEA